MTPFLPPPGYARIRVVTSFHELVTTPFAGGVNALCWPRTLPGDFGEVVKLLGAGDGIETLDEALYYSAAAYATLGRTGEFFPEAWRLIGAFEALIGFLMIGWSTAFITSKATRLMPG